MKIIFTKHARKRLMERLISVEHIYLILEKPDIVNRTFDNKFMAKKEFPNGAIEVVFTRERDKITVITVYYP